jgi:hypothetical protein
MKINVCVPTRGKDRYVLEYPMETIRNATLPGTRVVLGYDADDAAPSRAQAPADERVIYSVAPREDALGAKYNRCARAYDADLYVLSMDDVSIATPGWDAILARYAAVFKDGIGYLYMGREINGERLPSMIAVTRKVVDLIGFCQEYTPFWWCNTWMDEVATFIGGHGRRIIELPIKTRYPEGELPEPPRRDVNFWANFFDLTRPMRMQQAARLIEAMDDGATGKAVLQAMMRPRARELAVLNSNLREPEWGVAMEKRTEPRDPRHQRLVDQANETVRGLMSEAA